ncbi:MAG: polysaccharide deacetylase family protein [Halieaceae bacterium]
MRPAAILLLALYSGLLHAADHGVILLYHHVSELTPASTSVTPDQFRQQLDYLVQEQFTVLPLAQMLDRIYAGESLPDRSVAISFDDAYLSVFTEAWPQLQKRRMPFTVFVSTRAVDEGYAQTMSWQQMQSMDPALADFGAHSLSHAYLVRAGADESPGQWRQRGRTEIDASVARLEQALGRRVRSFAYPYGEYVAPLAQHLQSKNLYGLAQHSGAVDAGTPPQQIPRFPLAQGHADMDRFITALNARPLPILNRNMDSTLLPDGRQTEQLKLRLGVGPFRPQELACYSSDGTALVINWQGATATVQLPDLKPGRNKINCTAPSTERAGEFFWYSRLWILPPVARTWSFDQ